MKAAHHIIASSYYSFQALATRVSSVQLAPPYHVRRRPVRRGRRRRYRRRTRPRRVPFRRVIENKHSTEIGARLTMTVHAHTDARRRRRRRFNVGRVLVHNDSPAFRRSWRRRRFFCCRRRRSSSSASSSQEGHREQALDQGRSTAQGYQCFRLNKHPDSRLDRRFVRRFNVGGALVLNNLPASESSPNPSS